MAYSFDANKYKQIFEQRFGKGSFDSGLSQARSIGTTKVQAQIAKKDYSTRAKEEEKAAKKQEKYDAEQREKEKMYGDITGKEARSMREKAQAQGRGGFQPTYANKVKEQKALTKARESAAKNPFPSTDKLTPYQQQLRQPEEKKKKTILDQLEDLLPKKKSNNKESNAYIDAHKWVDKKVLQPIENKVARFANKAANELQLGQFERNKNNDKNPSFIKKAQEPAKTKGDKAADFAGSMFGMAAPIGVAYKGTTKAAQGISKLARVDKAGKASKYLNDAVRGGTAMAAYSTTKQGIDEAINPGDATFKQRAAHVGMDTALGTIGDPAIRGLGVLGSKGIDAGLKKFIKGDLPKFNGQVAGETANKLAPKLTPSKLSGPAAELPVSRSQSPVNLKAVNVGDVNQMSKEELQSAYEYILARKERVTHRDEGVTDQEYYGYLKLINDDLSKVKQLLGESRGGTPPFNTQRYHNPDQPMNEFLGKQQPESPLMKLAKKNMYEQRPLPDYSKSRPVTEAADNVNQYGVEVPRDLVESAPPQYWQKRYEDFVQQINQNYDTNRLTPEALDDLWSQFARYDEPVTLEQAVDLAYKGYKPNKPINSAEAWNQFGNRPPVSKNAKKILGLPTKQELAAIGPKKLSIQDSPMFRNETIRPLPGNGALKAEAIGPSSKSNPIVKSQDDHGYGLVDLQAERTKQYSSIVPNLKDINGIQGYMSDIYRNTEDVFGESFPEIKRTILDPFDNSKKEYVQMQEQWLNSLDKDIVKGLGIKKGSKLSKMVQDYGEKTISLEQLKKFEPDNWKKVVRADQWFRKAYNQLIDQVNASRASIYPNNPEKSVPKRDDYYRHFRELNGLEGLRNMFDTPAGINPQLAGTSDFTNPSSKFAGFMQKRGLGPYKSDAVGGFLNYLPSVSYSTKIDPHIPAFKEFSKSLKEASGDSKNINNYIEFLEDFSRDLAGKTNPFDRPIQKVLGRKAFGGLQWLNNRVKKNAILGNLGSTLAQVANVPNGIAFAKQHSVPGAMRTLKSIVIKNEPSSQSGFLKERFSHNMYQKFNTRLIEQPEKFASWVMTAADRTGTSFVWNSAYEKGLAKKVADPIKYADDATRKLVAGRGVGEVPLLQKSKAFQFIAPFQLEVANLWHVQRDFMKEKDFGALVTLYLGAWMLNKGMEETRGSKVVFDPIDAIHDAFTDEDLSGWEKGGRLAGEVLSNIPLGQTAANFYPEYGTKTLPTREEFFGDKDPNRFGTGLLVAKGVQDPLYKLALPFGGAQLQKTVKGFKGSKEEAVYTKAGDKLKYPVSPDPVNVTKGLLFGQGGFRETKEFYEKDRKPLGTKQTQKYLDQKAGLQQAYYNWVMQQREQNKK